MRTLAGGRPSAAAHETASRWLACEAVQIVARSALTDGGVLYLSVTDSGQELPELLPVDPSRVGGVGLQIVDRLSSQWGISPFPGGKTVWVTMSGRIVG